jgi:hypothetical protein
MIESGNQIPYIEGQAMQLSNTMTIEQTMTYKALH